MAAEDIFIIMMFIFFIGFFIFSLAFWVWMLVDSITRNFKSENEKIAWIVVIVLAGVLGALVYFFVVKCCKPKQAQPQKAPIQKAPDSLK